jgi:hypothetical protein
MLRPSKIHRGGVGVFATHAIAAGTLLQWGPNYDKLPSREIDIRRIKKGPIFRSLVERFGVFAGTKAYIPYNFSNMQIGWYVNHADDPNAARNNRWRYYATKNIKAGEEITIDYRTLDSKE